MLTIKVEVPVQMVEQAMGGEYLEKALGALGFVRSAMKLNVTWKNVGDLSEQIATEASGEAPTQTATEAGIMPSDQDVRETTGIELQIKAELAAEAETKKARRGRKPAETPAASAETAQAISTGAERIDPQDQADDAADKPTARVTRDDLRLAAGNYFNLFGAAAAIEDVPQIIGSAIADVPEDQIVTAIAKIGKSIGENPFKRALAGAEKPEAAALSEPAKPARKATKQEVVERILAYAAKFDGPDATPVDASTMPITNEDCLKVYKLIFGESTDKLSMVPADELSYGKLVDGLDEMIAKNPFNRTPK